MNSEVTVVTTDEQATGGVSPPSNSIRITRQGKIRHWVKHGLDFFQGHPDEPLTLHTAAAADVAKSTIPRLISVVEILKREYLKTLDAAAAGQQQLTGLHQYNEMQWERRGEIPAEGGDDRADSIIRALEGKNHPKLALTPSMKVTLCTKTLAEMHGRKGVTYQMPQTRRLSKAAKAKMRKRQEKKKDAV